MATGSRERGNEFRYLCEAGLRTPIIRACLFVWILVFAVGLLDSVALHAGKDEEGRWSIDFNNITISEALSQLSQVTGIKIYTKRPLENKITRSYTNRTIDEIIKDLCRDVSHASVWHFSEKGVDSIGIAIFDRGASGDAEDMARARRTNSRQRIVSRDSGYARTHNRRPVTVPRESIAGTALPEAGHGASTEEVDTENDEAEAQAEERDGESMSPLPESTGKPTSGATDSDEESPTDSPQEEEGLPTVYQSSGEESPSSQTPEERPGEER